MCSACIIGSDGKISKVGARILLGIHEFALRIDSVCHAYSARAVEDAQWL